MYVCMYVSVSACSYVCMRTWLYTQWRVMSEIMNDIAYFLVHQWRHCDHSSRDIGIRDFVLSHSQPLNLTVTEKILRWIFFFSFRNSLHKLCVYDFKGANNTNVFSVWFFLLLPLYPGTRIFLVCWTYAHLGLTRHRSSTCFRPKSTTLVEEKYCWSFVFGEW